MHESSKSVTCCCCSYVLGSRSADTVAPNGFLDTKRWRYEREGASIEAPKTPRGWVWGGVSPPHWGGVMEGAVPSPDFVFHFGAQNR